MVIFEVKLRIKIPLDSFQRNLQPFEPIYQQLTPLGKLS